MVSLAVIGAQWGDEGKGKIVDCLAESADVVVRFQGGHNAGHTLNVGGINYKLSLLPSGVLHPRTMGLIGNGVVVDPSALLAEIVRLREAGIAISPENLRIAETAHLILSVHRELDALRETAGKGLQIGTTQRGIGPAYEDKVGRRGIRLGDLTDFASLKGKIERLLAHHNALRYGFGCPPVSAAVLLEELSAVTAEILPYKAPVWQILSQAQQEGRRILFEGAQGSLLDVDHGTYPFVTSSNTVAGQIAAGVGIGPTQIQSVLGVMKAYTTRVGCGPFPTEQNGAAGAFLSERGREIGTVTGRSRRCGWFDAVLGRQAVLLNGINGIALTKLDVLDGLETLKICVGYRLGEVDYTYLPACESEQNQLSPIYEDLPGWAESTRGIRDYEKLPPEARAYIRRLEELLGASISLISTGPERESTIFLEGFPSQDFWGLLKKKSG